MAAGGARPTSRIRLRARSLLSPYGSSATRLPAIPCCGPRLVPAAAALRAADVAKGGAGDATSGAVAVDGGLPRQRPQPASDLSRRCACNQLAAAAGPRAGDRPSWWRGSPRASHLVMALKLVLGRRCHRRGAGLLRPSSRASRRIRLPLGTRRELTAAPNAPTTVSHAMRACRDGVARPPAPTSCRAYALTFGVLSMLSRVAGPL